SNFAVEVHLDKKKREETEEALFSLQIEVEREYHERGNVFMFGIEDNEIFPAVVRPENDTAYAREEWVSRSESMMDPQAAISRSSNWQDLEELLAGIRYEMPEGLENRAGKLMEKAGVDGDRMHQDVEGTYLLPMLDEDRYDRLYNR
ncbi:MAG: hypothetical protein ABEJ91_03165, partial [Candidatus Nanohaloarchaea archaeon]